MVASSLFSQPGLLFSSSQRNLLTMTIYQVLPSYLEGNSMLLIQAFNTQLSPGHLSYSSFSFPFPEAPWSPCSSYNLVYSFCPWDFYVCFYFTSHRSQPDVTSCMTSLPKISLSSIILHIYSMELITL